jgi:porin
VNEDTPRQRCGTAKWARSSRAMEIGSVGRAGIAALAVMFALPAGWAAAQEPGGKAPEESEELFEQGAPGGKDEGWLGQKTATGTWGGLRATLAEEGITFEGRYVADFLALTQGGTSRGGNWDYAGYTYLGIGFDLETLARLPGLSFYVEGGWSFGEDLARKTGSLFSPAQAFTGRAVRLTRMYLQQDLAEDELTLKIGRLATEDDFLSSPVYGEYVSAAINSVPGSILESTPGFTTFPEVQWGAVAAYKPLEQVRAVIGIYSSDDEINQDKEHGVDFSLNPDNGIMTIGEVDYLWKLGGSEETAGLPGEVKVGGWYDTGPRPNLRDEADNKGNNGGFYVGLQQMAFREGDADSTEGLTPWAVVTYAPKQSINTVPFFLGSGMVYQGLIPTRDDDRAAIGFYWGVLSRDIEDTSSENILEVAYTAQLTPWFYVRPDAQFIFQPGGSSETSNAVVLGGEIGITF